MKWYGSIDLSIDASLYTGLGPSPFIGAPDKGNNRTEIAPECLCVFVRIFVFVRNGDDLLIWLKSDRAPLLHSSLNVIPFVFVLGDFSKHANV